jgi:hypothetical protein
MRAHSSVAAYFVVSSTRTSWKLDADILRGEENSPFMMGVGVTQHAECRMR